MPDSLDSKLHFEIALYGARGCPVAELWSVLEQNQNVKIEQSQVDVLWHKLTCNSDFQFIKGPEQKTAANVTNIAYSAALQEHGQTLHVIMAREARRKTLTPSGAKNILSTNHFLALERIISAGREGITQVQLSRDIGTNAGGVYESVKKLEKLGMITRYRSSHHRGYTNICYYNRYSPRNEAERDAVTIPQRGTIPYDLALSKVLKMLEDAQGNILPLKDVIQHLHAEYQYGEKWIRGFCAMAEKKGYVQKVKVVSGNESHRCLKLLKTISKNNGLSTSSSTISAASGELSTIFEGDVSTVTASENTVNSVQTRKTKAIPPGMRNDLILQNVRNSGENGITQQELQQLLEGCSNLRRNLMRLESNGSIVSIVEVQGRLRRYRYFDLDGLRKYQQSQGDTGIINTAEQSSDVIRRAEVGTACLQAQKRQLDDSSATVDQTTSKKQKTGTHLQTSQNNITKMDHPNLSANSTSIDNAESDGYSSKQMQKFEDDSQSARRCGAKNVETEDTSRTLGKRKRRHSDDSGEREKPKDDSRADTEKFVRQQRNAMKGTSSVETQAARRKNALAQIISRDKVREANDGLAAEVSRAASDSSDGPNMARATLIKLAENLQLSGQVVVIRTMMPNLIGAPENKVLFLRPDIPKDDPLVHQCLELSRMSFAVKQHTNKRRVPEIRAELPSQPRQQSSQDVVRLAPGLYWHELALRHGWIQSRFLRARALHEFLWQAFHQQQRRFNLSQVLINMPLGLYCRIIGIAFHSDIVEEFLQKNDLDITLSQIPTDVRAKMVKRIHRLRNSLRTLIDVLIALELITLVDADPKNGGLYLLLDVGKVKDYSSKDRPLLQEVRLCTQQDVVSFWKELQYVCVYMPSKQSDLAECGVNDVLYAITLPRSWDSGSLLSIEQRRVLDSHADKIQGKVPLDDCRLIASLARELGISIQRVRRYYEVILEAYEKRKGKTIRLRKSRSARGAELDNKSYGEHHRQISTRKFSEGSRNATAMWTAKSSTGTYWRQTEVDILIHAYTIIRHRSRGNPRNVNWGLLHALFPERSRRACRHCLYSLQKTRPATYQQLEGLKAEWERIYEQGISTGEIIDERPWDTQNFDFLGQLEYFMETMRNKPSPSIRCIGLPTCLNAVNYEYKRAPNHLKEASAGVRSMSVSSLKNEPMDENFLLLLTIIKMIVLSPKNEYDSEAGYSLLRPFNIELVTRAISYLRKTGVLMRSKHRLDSRLPGRKFYIAQRFEKNLNEGKIPFKMLQKASDFAKNLCSSVTLDAVADGDMLALTSMVSENRIHLEMDNHEEYCKIRQANVYPKLEHDSLENQWIDHGFQLQAKALEIPDICSIRESTSQLVSSRKNVELKTEDEAEMLLSNQTEHTLYRTIRKCKEKGMNYEEIQEAAGHLGIHNEQLVAETLKSLMGHSVVLKVGLSTERYVASEFAGCWLVNALKPSSEGNIEYYKPRTWCDVHGNTITETLHKCAKLIMSDIVEYPGITLAKLCVNHERTMTKGEIKDLLEQAEKIGAIKCQKLKPKAMTCQISWFKKPSYQTATADEIYCYWPGRAYYSKLFDLR